MIMAANLPAAALHLILEPAGAAASELSELASPSGASRRAGIRHLACKAEDEAGRVTELGHINNLTCPVLAKLGDAFLFSKRAQEAEEDDAIMPGSRCITGKDAAVHVAYKPEGRVIIMAFKGTLRSGPELAALLQASNFMDLGNDLTAPRTLPSFLAGVRPDAEVHAMVSRQFDSLLAARRPDGRGLVDTIKAMTGGATPRRFVCCGYCVGGSVATLAAPWAALQVPTADVRCVTFGAPRVGNLVFVETFRWLVGCSYRVVYHKDSVPDKPAALVSQHFQPVHGSIYLDQDGVQSRSGGLGDWWGASRSNHAISLYGDALQAAAARNLDASCGCTFSKRQAAADSAYGGDQQGGSSSRDNAEGERASAMDPQGAVPSGDNAKDEAANAMFSDLAEGETAGPRHEGHSWNDEHPDGTASASGRGVAPDVTSVVDGKGHEKRATALPGHRLQQRGSSDQKGTSSDITDKPMRSADSGAGNGHPAHSSAAAHDGRAATGSGGGGEASDGKASRSNGLAGPRELLHSLSKRLARLAERGRHDNTRGAGRAYRQAVGEATATDHGSGLWKRAPDFLQRAYRLLQHEDFELDVSQLDALEKLLVMGKIGQAGLLAWAAYRDPADFDELTGVSNAVLIEDTRFGTHAYVAWLEGGTAIFAFRGTEDAQDGWQDIKAARRSIPFLEQVYPGTKAHLGFQQQLASVLDPERPEFNIGQVLMKLSGGQKPTRVLTCGHSRGGAVATLAAVWAALQYTQADVRCITFGSPRVGNARFKHAFHTLVNTSFRLVNSADPVPEVPPSFGVRYKHVGASIFLSKRGMELRRRPRQWKYRFNIRDHLIKNYDRALLALIDTVTP